MHDLQNPPVSKLMVWTGRIISALPVLMLLMSGVMKFTKSPQLVEGMARWAALLRERGVTPGDRVLVLVGPSPDWLEIMLAGLKIGAVTVPCPETLSAEALEVRIASSGARLVVATRSVSSLKSSTAFGGSGVPGRPESGVACAADSAA